MSSFIEDLNQWGGQFLNFAGPMLWQSSLLMVVLFAADFLIRGKIRASIRYALWLVVLVKLCLPPTLATPTSAAWWLFQNKPAVEAPTIKKYVVTYDSALPQSDLVPQTAPIPAPEPKLDDAGRALLASVMVSVGLLLWLGFRWWQVMRKVQGEKVNHELAGTLKAVQQAAGLSSRVRLKVVDGRMSPAVCGLFHPVILLSRTLVEKLSAGQLRAVLMHELFHLRRKDVWVNCAQALLQIVYWWHPLLWLANARIRRVREEAVDDAVMLALRDEAESYAPTLLEVAKLAFIRPQLSLGLVGIMESRSALRQRIERLVDFRPPRKAGLTLASVCGIFVFSALTLPMGQAPDTSRESPVPSKPKSPSPWPDPNYSGYRGIDLTAQFLIVDESAFQAVFPSLSNARKPQVVTSKQVDDLEVKLKQAGAQQFDSKAPWNWDPVAHLSGCRDYYRIGGYTNTVVTALTKDAGGNFRNILTGVVADLRATQPDWKPMDFNLLPLIDGDSVRCQLELAFRDNPNSRQHANITLPLGGAMLWIASKETSPGKCQLVVLRQNAPAMLYTRTFQMNTNVFLANLRQQVSVETNVTLALIQIFSKAGVKLTPPKAIFYNDGMGMLFVRATKQDLDEVEQIVVRLSDAPQIHIKVRFLEVPKGTSDEFEKITGITNQPHELVGILTSENAKTAIKALESRFGTEELAEPEVTTLSGRHTEMRSTEIIITVITNFVYQQGVLGRNSIVPQTAKMEIGPVVDMVPYVLSDGYTIDLTAIPSLIEFLGYDKSTNTTMVYDSAGQKIDLPTISPTLRVRRAEANLNLWDGQTVALGPLKTHFYDGGKEVSAEPDYFVKTKRAGDHPYGENTEIFVFITVTLVDHAGNRVHSDEDMPFAKNSIPPQDGP